MAKSTNYIGLILLKAFYSRLVYATKKQAVAVVQQGEEPKLNNHMSTILKALHSREKEIMKTLMKYNGHATQARIYHATGIPTTSLSRWVDSLERRELVESKRRGKLRDLRVTEKFRGE